LVQDENKTIHQSLEPRSFQRVWSHVCCRLDIKRQVTIKHVGVASPNKPMGSICYTKLQISLNYSQERSATPRFPEMEVRTEKSSAAGLPGVWLAPPPPQHCCRHTCCIYEPELAFANEGRNMTRMWRANWKNPDAHVKERHLRVPLNSCP